MGAEEALCAVLYVLSMMQSEAWEKGHSKKYIMEYLHETQRWCVLSREQCMAFQSTVTECAISGNANCKRNVEHFLYICGVRHFNRIFNLVSHGQCVTNCGFTRSELLSNFRTRSNIYTPLAAPSTSVRLRCGWLEGGSTLE